VCSSILGRGNTTPALDGVVANTLRWATRVSHSSDRPRLVVSAGGSTITCESETSRNSAHLASTLVSPLPRRSAISRRPSVARREATGEFASHVGPSHSHNDNSLRATEVDAAGQPVPFVCKGRVSDHAIYNDQTLSWLVNDPTGLPGPTDYFASEPHLAATASKINNGTRHVRVTALIQRHRVALRQAKNLGHSLSVDEVADIDLPRHTPSAYKR
jgi:hypothetical protein